jgi:hypothetical protein
MASDRVFGEIIGYSEVAGFESYGALNVMGLLGAVN